MAVSVTWSLTAAGAAAGTQDHGDHAAGYTTSGVQIWLSHDGEHALTNCRFWLGEKSGTYTGDATAAEDQAEFLGWGDYSTSGHFGGLQVNMNLEESFPSGSWPVPSSKYGDNYSAFYSYRGDCAASGVILSSDMSPEMTVAGIIPPSMDEWPSFQARIHIPVSGVSTGIRQVEQKLVFSYTS